MAAKAARKRPRGRAKTTKNAMPREVRAAYNDLRKGVAHLDDSILDIQAGLRRAEQKIEADARRRIQDLRKEARVQLKMLQSKQKQAARTLKQLSAAAGESWREIKRSADGILGDARATAMKVGKRFRAALRD